MENQLCASGDNSGASAVVAEFKVWQCALCGFVYDEAMGMPDEGIAPGTRWADIPDDWICPECSVGKSDFEMVEV
ncbi:Rubredoxin [Cupriavidus necator]|uniref:Rubredoxin n=1 Tax=Cupriavidus necator TaxID=106590 RepID=A0A1K0JG15_CUPNE|nr:Rubredoxin [Cupriavidus necator]